MTFSHSPLYHSFIGYNLYNGVPRYFQVQYLCRPRPKQAPIFANPNLLSNLLSSPIIRTMLIGRGQFADRKGKTNGRL